MITFVKVRVIAIDGPVAAGKTVAARAVAGRLGFACLDTGVMYRAVTWLALRKSVSMEDEEALTALAVNSLSRWTGPIRDLWLWAGRAWGRSYGVPR